MDYLDAVNEVLERAAKVQLPGHRTNIVAMARREFAKRGGCDQTLFAPIEEVLKECLKGWTAEQKREIWFSTESGAADGSDVSDDSIDMCLPDELLYHVAEQLSPDPYSDHDDTDDDE